MKKKCFKSSLLIASFTIGLGLVACGDKRADADVSTSVVADTNASSDAEEPAEEPAEDTESVFSDIEIDSAKIEFFYKYNYATGEFINSMDSEEEQLQLTLYSIELTDEQIALLNDEVCDIETIFINHECDCFIEYNDDYKLYLNDSLEFNCDSYENVVWRVISDGVFEAYDAEEFMSIIRDIVDDYCEENVCLKVWDNGIDAIIYDGELVNVTDDAVARLEGFKFERVEYAATEERLGRVIAVVQLSGGNSLQVFESSDAFAYLDGPDYGYFVGVKGSHGYLKGALESLYYNQVNNLGVSSDVSSISLIYNGKTVAIDDELAAKFIELSTTFSYNQYDWLDDDYEIEDSIEIKVDNCSYFIPVDSGYANRYYLSEAGELYLVSGSFYSVESELFDALGISR